VELLCEVSDGLFSTRIGFNFNVHLSSANEFSTLAIKNNIIAPIFQTIELDENIELPRDLTNLGQLLVDHLNKNPTHKLLYDVNDEYLNEMVQFSLRNYKDLFVVNKTSKVLCLRRLAKLDREFRDTYELFIDLRDINENEILNEVASLVAKNKYFIPTKIRILVKLNDLNDNKPRFYHPIEATQQFESI
jgi:hypothetical protein